MRGVRGGPQVQGRLDEHGRHRCHGFDRSDLRLVRRLRDLAGMHQRDRLQPGLLRGAGLRRGGRDLPAGLGLRRGLDPWRAVPEAVPLGERLRGLPRLSIDLRRPGLPGADQPGLRRLLGRLRLAVVAAVELLPALRVQPGWRSLSHDLPRVERQRGVGARLPTPPRAGSPQIPEGAATERSGGRSEFGGSDRSWDAHGSCLRCAAINRCAEITIN